MPITEIDVAIATEASGRDLVAAAGIAEALDSAVFG